MHPRTVVLASVTAAAMALCTMALLLVLLLAGLGGPLAGGCAGDGGIGGGSVQIGPRSWSAEQTANAQTITVTAIGRGLPRRAAVIAVAAAIVESSLTNLTRGDRDSLGLFQQRPSQGWGDTSEILNPARAAERFYDHLVQIPHWATLPAGQAAQAVQRSSFPERYGPQEGPAADLVAKFWTGLDNPAPAPPDARSNPAKLATLISTTGCPDQGGSNTALDPAQLPAGFTLPEDPRQRAAVSYALAQLGKPYVWGAKGPTAFDCSGLVQAAWAAAGIGISAGTNGQVHDGTAVAGLDQLQPGDLLFIPGADGTAANPGHVGMYIGHGLVVNAYDSNHGVILEKLTAWQPKVVAVRRITAPTRPVPQPNLALPARSPP